MNKKFTKSPIINSDLVGKDAAIEEFVRGSLLKTEIKNNSEHSEELPWENLDSIEKVKGINLRITKADLSKLQYISKYTPYSIQAFCYECISNAIEAKLAQLK